MLSRMTCMGSTIRLIRLGNGTAGQEWQIGVRKKKLNIFGMRLIQWQRSRQVGERDNLVRFTDGMNDVQQVGVNP